MPSPRFLVPILLAILALESAAAQVTVSYVNGEAWYRRDAAAAWEELEPGMVLETTGFVRTGPTSSTELARASTWRIFIASNTLALLGVGGPKEPKGIVDHILVMTGTILSDVQKKGTDFQVRTRSATMAVRGTQFSVLANARGQTLLGVREGSVASLRRPEMGKAPLGFVVAAGYKLSPDSSGPPVALTESDRAYLDFPALADLARGQEPLSLFDHYAGDQGRLFAAFADADLDDRRLFEARDLDAYWTFLMEQDEAFRKELERLGGELR